MMKILFKKMLAGCFMPYLLLACKKDVSDTPDGSTGGTGSNGATPHVIQGTIFDANGNKFDIPNSIVNVRAWGPSDIGHDTRQYNIPMDGNSHYEEQVADGIYAFHASSKMPLNGTVVTIDLE